MSMLSLNTNAASLFTQSHMGFAQRSLNTAMTRMGTGLRINSAMDDASGLQIAKRMESDSRGMQVAMRNAQNGISMLQTAEGSLNEATNIVLRMKELATEAASTGSSSTADREALQAEFDQLGAELGNVIRGTRYGSEALFAAGKLTHELTFQIGASRSEVMTVDVSGHLTEIAQAAGQLSSWYANNANNANNTNNTNNTNNANNANNATRGTRGTELTGNTATTVIEHAETLLSHMTKLRSNLGANAKRLEHIYNNQSNVLNNTEVARSRIMDADYAKEQATMSSRMMLMQAGTSMLKSSGMLNQLALSLMQ